MSKLTDCITKLHAATRPEFHLPPEVVDRIERDAEIAAGFDAPADRLAAATVRVVEKLLERTRADLGRAQEAGVRGQGSGAQAGVVETGGLGEAGAETTQGTQGTETTEGTAVSNDTALDPIAEQWWNYSLTRMGRVAKLKEAGIELPGVVEWKDLTAEERAKLDRLRPGAVVAPVVQPEKEAATTDDRGKEIPDKDSPINAKLDYLESLSLGRFGYEYVHKAMQEMGLPTPYSDEAMKAFQRVARSSSQQEARTEAYHTAVSKDRSRTLDSRRFTGRANESQKEDAVVEKQVDVAEEKPERSFTHGPAADDFGGESTPVANAIRGVIGGLLSKSQALKKWGAARFAENKSLWDDAPKFHHPTHNKVYSPSGLSPDKVADALAEMGLLREGDVSAMWAALEKESRSAAKTANEFRAQSAEYRAVEAKQDAFDAANGDTTKPPIAASDLNVGDVVQVGTEKMKVKEVDPDTFEVTLEDGNKFGVQTVEDGEVIYGEIVAKAQGTEEPAKPAPAQIPKLKAGQKQGDLLAGSTEDAFNLAGESGIDGAMSEPVKRVASAPTRAVESNAAATADAGKELTYNKRNRRTGGVTWVEMEGMNPTLKSKEAQKGNVYPRPDYEKLVADGMPVLVSHLVKQVYDSVAAKPVTRALPTDADFKSYIEGINRVMDGVMKWAADSEAVAALVKASDGSRRPMGIIENMQRDKAKDLVSFVYPGGDWKPFRDELVRIGGNKVFSALQPGYREMKKGAEEIGKGWPAAQEQWKKQGYQILPTSGARIDFVRQDDPRRFVIVGIRSIATLPTEEAAKQYVADMKPFVLLDKYGRLVSQHESQEAAEEAARGIKKRDGTKKVGPMGISADAARREGPEHRMPGENVSSERVKEAFGFTGINFGTWMKGDTNEKERQLHLNHIYDSFMDLAEVMGIPPKAISLNGLLGIAVGAQGNAGAAAHFVPGVNEINLTRENGAGSLAHEWAHALDHYFANQAGRSTSSEPFLSAHLSGSKTVTGEIRPEIVAQFKAIVSAMNKREQTPEEVADGKTAQQTRLMKYVSNWLMSIKRDYMMEKVPEAEFNAIAKDIMALNLGDGKVSAGSVQMSKRVDDLRDLYKQKTGRLYSLEQIKGLQGNLDAAVYAKSAKAAEVTHRPQMVDTNYTKAAQKMDDDQGKKKPYWNTTIEKFARAFDAFVADTLESKARKNTYLSHGGKDVERTPQGDERTKINAAFAALVDEVETRETEQGVGLYASPAVGYADVPDSLMGFRKNGPQKGFEESNYRFVQPVRVTWADGQTMLDAVKGMNQAHALERARRNWKDAESIEPVAELPMEPGDIAPIKQGYVESMGLDASPAVDRDAEYLAAVEAGDMAAAQRLVDEAARAAGYSSDGYHSGPSGITEFLDTTQTQVATGTATRAGIYFSRNRETAASHTHNGSTIYKVFLRANKPYQAKSRITTVEESKRGEVGAAMFTPEQRDQLKAQGFDSVEFDDGELHEIAVFSPNQVKSADPVTRDEAGKVIPLSQRFNSESDSILYASPAVDLRQILEEADSTNAVKADPMKARELRPDAMDWARRLIKGRKDVLEMDAPGAGDAITDSEISAAKKRAALGQMLKAMEAETVDHITKALGPDAGKAEIKARRKAFVAELLPVAARLNATGYDSMDNFVFGEFSMRAGTLNKRFADKAAKTTGDIWIGRDGEALRIGEYIEDLKAYQLHRTMTEKRQARIYRDFQDRYPELAHFLNRWIQPGQADARVVDERGTVLPAFNRHALRKFFGDVSPYGELDEVEGYVPEVARTASLAGMIVTGVQNMLNKRWKSGAREYKSGDAREFGQVKDLFAGFGIRALEAYAETERRDTAEKLLAAAVKDIPADGLVPNGWMKVNPDNLASLVGAYGSAHGLNERQLAAFTAAVAKGDADTLKKLIGQAWGLLRQNKMMRKEVLGELVRPLTDRTVRNLAVAVLDSVSKSYIGGLLTHPFSWITNMGSNELFKLMRIAQRALYGATVKMMGLVDKSSDRAAMQRDGSMALREAWELTKGLIYARRWNMEQINAVVPKEMFESNTGISGAVSSLTEEQMTAVDLLKRANVPAAILKAVGYSDMDVKAKQALAYASYMAHAQQALADHERSRGVKVPKSDRAKWMRDWLNAAGPEVSRQAHATAVAYAMDYENIPWWMDERTSSTGLNIMRRLLLPFIKWPYNMARQMKRFGGDSALDVAAWVSAKTVGRAPGAIGETARAWQSGRRASGTKLANSVAHLATFGLMYAAMRALLAAAKDDDEVGKLGRSFDMAGDRLGREWDTSSRVNITDISGIGTVVGALARMNGDDGSNDFWLRTRNLPYASPMMAMAATMDALNASKEKAPGRRADALEAWKSFVGDFWSEGVLMSAMNTIHGNESKYTSGQGVMTTLGGMVVDLGASRVAPVPLMSAARDLVDPKMRRLNDSQTLGYDPGFIEGVESRIPGLSKNLPPKGTVTTRNLENATTELAALKDEPKASRVWVDPKSGNAKATFVDPADKRDIPRWRTLLRMTGTNVKPINREGYKAAVKGKESRAEYKKLIKLGSNSINL